MNESKATRYQRLRRRARAAGAASAALMLSVVALTPLTHMLARFAEQIASGVSGWAAAAVALAAFVALVVLLWELASLPAVIYLARRVDAAYGQGRSTIEEVLGAQAQATAVAVPAALVAGAVVLASASVAGRWWWLLAGMGAAAALAAALRAGPACLARLGDIHPLGRPDLVGRLAALTARARVPVAGIDEWVVDDAAGPTALVTGVGRARRILLSSELARTWPVDEVAVIVAHELAHHVYGDLWRSLALDVLVLWTGLFAADRVLGAAGGVLGIGGPGELAALPLVALVAATVWVMAGPIRHAWSRRLERRADTYALALTGGIDAFSAAVTRLGARRLAEERPSALTRWLHHSHPSVGERLALAARFRAVGLARTSPVHREADWLPDPVPGIGGPARTREPRRSDPSTSLLR